MIHIKCEYENTANRSFSSDKRMKRNSAVESQQTNQTHMSCFLLVVISQKMNKRKHHMPVTCPNSCYFGIETISAPVMQVEIKKLIADAQH